MGNLTLSSPHVCCSILVQRQNKKDPARVWGFSGQILFPFHSVLHSGPSEKDFCFCDYALEMIAFKFETNVLCCFCSRRTAKHVGQDAQNELHVALSLSLLAAPLFSFTAMQLSGNYEAAHCGMNKYKWCFSNSLLRTSQVALQLHTFIGRPRAPSGIKKTGKIQKNFLKMNQVSN